MISLFRRYKPLYLFCPGPVHVAENVRKAAVEVEIGHREPEFSEIVEEINDKLLKVLEIRKPSAYFSFAVTGSSSASNEMILSNAVGKKNILVVTNGEFGDRLYNISKLHDLSVKKLDFGWGNAIDILRVEECIKKYKIQVIAMVHHETSTGMLNDVATVGVLAKKYKNLFIVDAVSSSGAEKIDMEKWNIDFLTGATGKAICAFPGMSFIVGRVKEFEKLKNVKSPTLYLDLYKFYHYSKDLKQTPNTPAVPSFLAFDEALENILEEGVIERRKKIKRYAEMLRAEFKALGLQPFVKDEKQMSSVLTTLYVPEGMTPTDIQKKLREKRIVVYAGKGPIKNDVFQVANIGDLSQGDIEYFISAIREIVKN